MEVLLLLLTLLIPASPAQSDDGNVWDRLAECESGGNWQANTGNGYSGGLQFANSTWQANGGSTAEAWAASREEQIAVAQRVYDQVGWSAWPGCAAQLGLSGDPGGSGGSGGGSGDPSPEPAPEPAPQQEESSDDGSSDDGGDDSSEQELPTTL